MARRKKLGIADCVGLVAILAIAGAWQKSTAYGICALVAVLLLAGLLTSKGRCKICGCPIRRTYYKWRIDGRWTKTCPECNSNLRRRASKKAINSMFD